MVVTTARYLFAKAFDPNQPRDAHTGRWVRRGGGGSSTARAVTLAKLMDPADRATTPTALRRRLAGGQGTAAQRQEWTAALTEFHRLADEGERDERWPKYVPLLASYDSLDDLEQRTLPRVKGQPHLEAAVLRAVDASRRGRETGSFGMHGSLRFRDQESAAAWAKQTLPVPPNMTPTEQRAIYTYTSGDEDQYLEINEELRTPGSQSPSTRNTTRFMRQAMARVSLPAALTVFRGETAKGLKAAGYDTSDPASMVGLVGAVLDQPTFGSTTLGNRSEFEHPPVAWMLRLPAGSRSLNVNRPGLSQYDNEQEILVDAGYRRLVHAVYRSPDPDDRKWYIEAELVERDWKPPADWVPDPVGDAYQGYMRNLPTSAKMVGMTKVADRETRFADQENGVTVTGHVPGFGPAPQGPVTGALVSVGGRAAGVAWFDGDGGRGYAETHSAPTWISGLVREALRGSGDVDGLRAALAGVVDVGQSTEWPSLREAIGQQPH